MRTLQATSPRRGLTLVELMVAIGIFMFGMTGILAMFSLAARSQQHAGDYATAARMARQIEAALRINADKGLRPAAGTVPGALDLELPAARDGYKHYALEGYPQKYSFSLGACPFFRPGEKHREVTQPEAYFVEIRIHWHLRERLKTVPFSTVVIVYPPGER